MKIDYLIKAAKYIVLIIHNEQFSINHAKP